MPDHRPRPLRLLPPEANGGTHLQRRLDIEDAISTAASPKFPISNFLLRPPPRRRRWCRWFRFGAFGSFDACGSGPRSGESGVAGGSSGVGSTGGAVGHAFDSRDQDALNEAFFDDVLHDGFLDGEAGAGWAIPAFRSEDLVFEDEDQRWVLGTRCAADPVTTGIKLGPQGANVVVEDGKKVLTCCQGSGAGSGGTGRGRGDGI